MLLSIYLTTFGAVMSSPAVLAAAVSYSSTRSNTTLTTSFSLSPESPPASVSEDITTTSSQRAVNVTQADILETCQEGDPNPNAIPNPDDPFWPTLCDYKFRKYGECTINEMFKHDPKPDKFDWKELTRKEFCLDETREIRKYLRARAEPTYYKCGKWTFDTPSFVEIDQSWNAWFGSTCKNIATEWE